MDKSNEFLLPASINFKVKKYGSIKTLWMAGCDHRNIVFTFGCFKYWCWIRRIFNVAYFFILDRYMGLLGRTSWYLNTPNVLCLSWDNWNVSMVLNLSHGTWEYFKTDVWIEGLSQEAIVSDIFSAKRNLIVKVVPSPIELLTDILPWCSSMIFFRKIQIIFELENWLWKSKIGDFCQLNSELW